MYQCKTKRHTWLQQGDAAKCCNGYARILVVGNVAQASNVAYDAQACTSYGRAWVRSKE